MSLKLLRLKLSRLEFPKLKGQLFWKILGVFWLTIILTIITNVYITRQIAQVEQQYERVQRQLQDFAYDAVVVYENSGITPLQEWYQSIFVKHALRVVLLDKQNKPIGKPVESTDKQKANHEHRPGFIPTPWRRAYRPLTHQSILAVNGQKYVLKILPSPFMHEALSSLHDYKFYRLLVSCFIIALGSLWLSRSVALPIKRLTKASNLLAEGDLTVRVKTSIGQRSDELGELACAFDHMAERTEALVSSQKQLLRDISHELKTPLTRQKIAIELAKSADGDNTFLEKIERQNNTLNTLINSLLTFSRLSDGSNQLPTEIIDSTELLDNICDAAALEAEDKKLTIEQKLAAKTCFQGSWVLATRAIDNILGNALKYSPEHATIFISTEQQNNELLIKIQDQGPGIGPEHWPHIFEPFYRVDESRNQAYGGYGLGLAIVDQTMKQHHGRVELKNTKPNGLCVTLYFPL